MLAPDILELPISRLLEEIASGEPGPAAGAGAAAVVAIAAGVVAACGRASLHCWREAGGAIAQAEALRARAAPLAQADVQAFEAASVALRSRDARDACALAAGATQAAAQLVEVNLAVTKGDPRLAEARALARDAADAGRRSTA